MRYKTKLLLYKLYLLEISKKLLIFIIIIGILLFAFISNGYSLSSIQEDYSIFIIFLMIVPGLIFSLFGEMKSKINKGILIKEFADRINQIDFNINELINEFNINKDFVNTKVNLHNIGKINNSNLEEINNIISFFSENENILLNNKLINKFIINKSKLETIVNDLEIIFLDIKKTKYKKQLLKEYKKIVYIKKTILSNINTIKQDIKDYLDELEGILKYILNNNNKKLLNKDINSQGELILFNSNTIITNLLKKIEIISKNKDKL